MTPDLPARFSDLSGFARFAARETHGPVALILCEDAVEVVSTARHHRRLGFGAVALLAAPGLVLPGDLPPGTCRVDAAFVPGSDAAPMAANAVMAPLAGRWVYTGYNAEYLFYPFCETRSVTDLLEFHAEERRAAMAAVVLDLYAGDLARSPDAVDRDAAWFDTEGYYALPRKDPKAGWAPKPRQFDIFGGLRRRFEEHVPYDRRRIDRIALVQAARGRRMAADFTFAEDDLNTRSGPWHNTLTAAVASFRTAKALRSHPGARAAIDDFRWEHATQFDWRPDQLLNLGLMEPGQWF